MDGLQFAGLQLAAATALPAPEKTEQALSAVEAKRALRNYLRDQKKSRDAPKDSPVVELDAAIGRGSGPGIGVGSPQGANTFAAAAAAAQYESEAEWAQHQHRNLTLMLRNLPLQYTRDMFCERLSRLDFAGKYDFLYLPIDRSTNQNMGYAFVNFRSQDWCLDFFEAFDGVPASKCLPGFGGNRVCRVRRAEVQGRDNNLQKLAQPGFSDALKMHEAWQPLFFDDLGAQIAFEHLAFAEAAGLGVAGIYGTGRQAPGWGAGGDRGGARASGKQPSLDEDALLWQGGFWPGMEAPALMPTEEAMLWANPPPEATPEWVASLLAPALEGPPKSRRAKQRAGNAAALGASPPSPGLNASAPEFSPGGGPILNPSAPEFTPLPEPAPLVEVSALPEEAALAPAYVPDAGVLGETMRATVERMFSVECVSHDEELRMLMDDQGWVKLSNLVAFPQLRSHVSAGEVIKLARWIGESKTVEVSRDGSLCVRIKSEGVREAFPRMENIERFRPPKVSP